MRTKRLLGLALAAAALMSLGGCGSNSNSGGDSTGGSATVSDPQARFAGSAACQSCHQEIYADFVNSGHPYKLNKVVDGRRPTYPFSTLAGFDLADLEINPETLAADPTRTAPADYSEVSYVIGGYGWKARWLYSDGYIFTGPVAQYNLDDGSAVAYNNDAGHALQKYNCGNCHTTGWRRYDASLNPNRQDGLPGMDGTFVAGGIQCESCHGAGKQHIATQDAGDIVRMASARTTAQLLAADAGYARAVACSECHTRDGEKDYPDYVSPFNEAFPGGSPVGGRIAASGGLAKHHEQFDEMLGINPDTGAAMGKHGAVLTCVDCHDPHKTIKYADQTGDSGLYRTCEDCHGAGAPFAVDMPADSYMADFDCEDCHMPKLAKSALKHDPVGTGPATGDISSHIFKIDLAATDQDTDDGKFLYPWITKAFACGTCHNGVDAFDVSTTDFSGYTFHKASVATDDTSRFAGKYAGSKVCAECHETNYNDFILSGHPFKLNKVTDDTVPSYPFSDISGFDLADLEINPETVAADPSRTAPADYSEVSYVIGGYGWKARWLYSDGFIFTGPVAQYNLDGTTAAYNNDAGHAMQKYNCGNCHTTGWQRYDGTLNPATQDDLPGMDGTFAMAGIQCESCHGAALEHVVTRDAGDVTEVASQRTTAEFLSGDAFTQPVACGECHTRDGEHDYPSYQSPFEAASGLSDVLGGRIAASGGFAKHHEQYDELLGIDPDDIGGGGLGKHLGAGLTCVSCHSPHATTKYQDHPDNTSSVPGVEVDCENCHTTVGFTLSAHASQECVDCHMPKAAKSAVKTDGALGADTFGDIRSHVFKIDLSKDPATEQFDTDTNADGINEGGFMYPWLARDFACGFCHADTAAHVTELNTDHGGLVHPAGTVP